MFDGLTGIYRTPDTSFVAADFAAYINHFELHLKVTAKILLLVLLSAFVAVSGVAFKLP
jgi:hypothetical protein